MAQANPVCIDSRLPSEIALEQALRGARHRSEFAELQRAETPEAARDRYVRDQHRLGRVFIPAQEVEAVVREATERQRAREDVQRRAAGVVVQRNLVLADELGRRLECPEGMQLPSTLIAQLGPREVQRLVTKGILIDYRGECAGPSA